MASSGFAASPATMKDWSLLAVRSVASARGHLLLMLRIIQLVHFHMLYPASQSRKALIVYTPG